MKLFHSLLEACDTAFDWSDALVVPGIPIMLVSPSGNREFGAQKTSPAEIRELAHYVWEQSNHGSGELDNALASGAIKVAIDVDICGPGDKPDGLRFRFTILRALVDGGIQVIVRKVSGQVPTLQAIGFDLHTHTPLMDGSGIILVTGPTKQGKSTLVAAMVEQLRVSRAVGHIVTIEDPIEYRHPVDPHCVVTQREIGVHSTSYEDAAEDALRMAPGAISIGEIRDTGAALATLNLGESGHLVVATMQATTVEGALLKLRALTNSQSGTALAITTAVKAVIRTALVPTPDGDHYKLAYEWLLNSGADVPELLAKWDMLKIRESMRQKSIAKYGGSLDSHLSALVRAGDISQEAANAASNDQFATSTLSEQTSQQRRFRPQA